MSHLTKLTKSQITKITIKIESPKPEDKLAQMQNKTQTTKLGTNVLGLGLDERTLTLSEFQDNAQKNVAEKKSHPRQ